MEEKERYIILSDRQVKDTQNNSQGFMSINSICKTLNQQDKELSKLRASYQQVKEENQQLKQQLAEKEKEISNVNGLVRERDKQIKNLKTNKKRVIEHKNKTKISFAIEQLEKVKENIKKVPIIDFDLSGNFEKMYKQDAIRQIDNQIKELKGEE